ncbi:prepilin peptidase [Brevundimonas sp.]|uniref:prepilin peptidase n=1 Tax=Brevundimonas sp. TaxID=1871086 RepID=UPI002FC7F781
MSFELVTGIALTLSGLAAGWLTAFASHRLPPLELGPKPRRYLVMPVACAFIGMASAVWAQGQGLPSPWTAVFTALLGWQLLLIAVVDAENFWLPDVVTVPLGITGIIAAIVLPYPLGQGWMMALLSALFGFSALWLLAFLYRKLRGRSGLGGGDPILLGMGAAWVGALDLAIVLLVASLSGLAVVIGLKLAGRNLDMHSKMPFGTYLAIGFAVAWLMV